ncbi:ankyrin repeat domain-containing protein [Candidatus Chromulinivorax destructor]|nr:ankyrin repeat domain-containing protein [Candidatus Chromulinivorax destructor]
MKKLLLLLMMMHYQSCVMGSAAIESKEDSDYESESGYQSDSYAYDSGYEYNSDGDDDEDYQINTQADAIDRFISQNNPLLKEFKKIHEQDPTQDTLESYLEKQFNQYQNISHVNYDQIAQDAQNYIDFARAEQLKDSKSKNQNNHFYIHQNKLLKELHDNKKRFLTIPEEYIVSSKKIFSIDENNKKTGSDEGLVTIDQYDGNHNYQFNEDDRDTFTHLIEHNSQLREGFKLIREHNGGSYSFFGNFLKEAMTENGYDVGTIIFAAYKYIADNTKNHFLSVLKDAIEHDKKFVDIEDPLFLFVLSLKGDFMKDFIFNWIDETYNFRQGFALVQNNSFKDVIENYLGEENFDIVSNIIFVQNSLVEQMEPLFIAATQDINIAHVQAHEIENPIFLYILHTEWIRNVVPTWLQHNNITLKTVEEIFSSVRKNNILDIMLFIIMGGNPNVTERYQAQSLLMTAIVSGHSNIVSFLLRQPEIDVNYQDKDWRTALLIASSTNKVEIVKMLLNHNDISVNLASKDGNTPLYRAASNGHVDIVEILLNDSRIHVNVTNTAGVTALMMASMQGHTAIVRKLLEHPGIEINAQDRNKLSALMKAAAKGHEQIVRMLMAAGARIDFVDDNGFNAFILAAKSGHVDTVKFLLNHIDNKNIQDNSQRTALFYAAQNGHTEMVRLLFNAGIDKNIQDKNGKTAYDVAINREIENILRAR